MALPWSKCFGRVRAPDLRASDKFPFSGVSPTVAGSCMVPHPGPRSAELTSLPGEAAIADKLIQLFERRILLIFFFNESKKLIIGWGFVRFIFRNL